MKKEKEGKYLYGIIETKQNKSFGPIGIGGRGDLVHTVNYLDLAVVTSSTPVIIYDPVRENALAHQEVISIVMEQHDILPMSFGIIAENTAEIRNLIKKNYARFKTEMSKIRNKIELGLKVYWQKESFAKEMAATNRSISKIKESLAEESPEATYYERINLGQMVASAAEAKRSFYHQEIVAPLEHIAVAARNNDIINPRMVLNASFLVAKEKMPDFDLKVEELHQKFNDRLDMRYTGPWPPYNFINLRINPAKSR